MAVYFNEIRDLKGDPIHALRTYAEVLSIPTDIASPVLDAPRFPLWSGSSKPHQHHYGKGGLARHTLEVVELCLNANRYFGDLNINDRALFLSALYHDAGKMWDYEPVDEKMLFLPPIRDYENWQGSQHKRRIHHISRSVILWNEAAKKLKEADTLTTMIDEITHAILAHHMQREWGSPVSPNTKMAWILSMCDNMSARVDDCEKFDRH